jgi:hypothetical protein
MSLRNEDEKGKLRSGYPRFGQTTGPISSLHEAGFHTLDTCVIDSPLSEVILPLMRNCFFSAERCTPFSCCKGVMATS